MAAYSYSLDFMGYVTDEEHQNLPEYSGIYCVYEAEHVKKSDSYNMIRLLYIGEGGNIRERIERNENLSLWQFSLKSSNKLAFSFAKVDSFNRLRVTAALVFHHKPLMNTDYNDHFPFHPTIIRSSGETALLDTMFSVVKTSAISTTR